MKILTGTVLGTAIGAGVAASSDNGWAAFGGTMFAMGTAIVGGTRFANIVPDAPVISALAIGLPTVVAGLAGIGIGTLVKHHAQDGAQQLRQSGQAR